MNHINVNNFYKVILVDGSNRISIELTEYPHVGKIEPINAAYTALSMCNDKTISIDITGDAPFLHDISDLIDCIIHSSVPLRIFTNGVAPVSGYDSVHLLVATIICIPLIDMVHNELLPYIDAYHYTISHKCVDVDGLPVGVAKPHASFDGTIFVQPRTTNDIGHNTKNVQQVLKSAAKYGYEVVNT